MITTLQTLVFVTNMFWKKEGSPPRQRFRSVSKAGTSKLFFSGKGPHPLLCAAARGASVKFTVSVKPNRQNFCVIFRVYT
jgi:hypothetical protein